MVVTHYNQSPHPLASHSLRSPTCDQAGQEPVFIAKVDFLLFMPYRRSSLYLAARSLSRASTWALSDSPWPMRP